MQYVMVLCNHNFPIKPCVEAFAFTLYYEKIDNRASTWHLDNDINLAKYHVTQRIVMKNARFEHN